MRFLVDESADARLVKFLTERQHDAVFVAQGYRPGIRDEDVLALAHSETRILITDDRDFGELVFRLARPHTGVIFFRLRETALSVRTERLAHVLENYTNQLNEFLVVTEDRVRVRSL